MYVPSVYALLPFSLEPLQGILAVILIHRNYSSHFCSSVLRSHCTWSVSSVTELIPLFFPEIPSAGYFLPHWLFISLFCILLCSVFLGASQGFVSSGPHSLTGPLQPRMECHSASVCLWLPSSSPLDLVYICLLPLLWPENTLHQSMDFYFCSSFYLQFLGQCLTRNA